MKSSWIIFGPIPRPPPGYNAILIKAESYINQRLSKANEAFRHDAKKRIFIDRK